MEFPIFVPMKIGNKLTLPPESGLSWSEEMTIESADGFTVRGRALLGEETAAHDLCKRSGLCLVDVSAKAETRYAIFSWEVAEESLEIDHEPLTPEEAKDKDAKPEALRYPKIMNSTRSALVRFAQYTGLTPSFHFRSTRVCNLYPEGEEDTVHLILGASPPGAVCTSDKQHICEVRLDPHGYYVPCNGVTPGRGTAFKDSRETGDGDIGQIVGRNIFLCAPKLRRENSALFSDEGGDLILKLLACVSKALVDEKNPESEEIELSSGAAYEQYLRDRLPKENEHVGRLILQADDKMEKARADYREALSSKRNYLTIQRTFAEEDELVISVAAAEWDRIQAFPLVKRLTTLGPALHAETQPLVIVHDGKRYPLGAFVVRLRVGGYMSVWAKAPTHPKGIAHPHISERSSLCFGNAGIEIEKAAAEMRLADALSLVLDWLENGYDETLADVKITEWPEEGVAT